jgi:hypothetical protein
MGNEIRFLNRSIFAHNNADVHYDKKERFKKWKVEIQ